ncbi:MAG TPA: hypothetical protein VFS60_13350, partial [Thermoanaerobaculia bacterium]|nr:hypothetical protein [Thermoanaerobaculia bacterium]
GSDPSSPADDRARALAKLAVDYSDPKFLNMADDGRERAINQSFVASVQEMARQDKTQDLLEGHWYRLVESVDQGRQTGVDDNGEAVRSESHAQWVERRLEEQRRELLNRVSIKERAFVFHREGVNQYVELVSRLLDDIRAARHIIDEGVRGLEAAAGEGELIGELKLDPIAERYLVVRLRERCESSLIPEAQAQLEKARVRDVGNAKVRERLERELFESLQEAAAKRSLLNRDQAFLNARDEAQEYFRGVASAARKTFDAEIRLRQLRKLVDYLERRSRQYARLATRMDSLVQDLEREAERLRRGDAVLVAPLALRVEVFETLDEPRQRIWNRVYHALFVDGGRYIGTFDRQLLAETIARELEPVVRADGGVAERSLDETVNDLRRALHGLGLQRLRPHIFGGPGQSGLDLVRGLELEARLTLQAGKPAGETVSAEEIEQYRERKFRALAQMAGVLARVNTAESKTLDDGVKVNRTRQLIVGLSAAGGSGSERFLDRLRAVLSAGGRQVKTDHWHDTQLLLVHDVELPIPLYYIEPIVGEIEDAYLKLAADERRAYQLHIDYNWEKALPNLNPRRSEITIGWALRVLAEGLVTQVVGRQAGQWIWRVDGQAEIEPLGQNLSGALYRLGEIHRIEDLQKRLDRELQAARARLGPALQSGRRTQLFELLDSLMGEVGRRELRGEMTREDVLDRPILRALKRELESLDGGALALTPDERLYDRLKFD